jgi:hypothetical protein
LLIPVLIKKSIFKTELSPIKLQNVCAGAKRRSENTGFQVGRQLGKPGPVPLYDMLAGYCTVHEARAYDQHHIPQLTLRRQPTSSFVMK